MKMTIRTDPAATPLVLDFDALTNRDVMALEDLVGETLTDWSKNLSAEGRSPSMRDLTVMVWLARRQNGESSLRFDDVEFTFANLEVDVDDPEEASGDEERPTVTLSGPIDVVSTPVG